MEKLNAIISAATTLLAAGGAFLVALLKVFKGKKTIKSSYEQEVAVNAINAEIERLVKTTEVAYGTIDKVLKLNNESAGSLKKRDVLLSLHDFCLDRGYTWDEDAMSAAIDAKVDFTKTVNSK